MGVSGETTGCDTGGGQYGSSGEMIGCGCGGDASGETLTKQFYILEENTQTYIVNLL